MREVMRYEAVVLPIDTSVARAAAVLAGTTRAQAQRLYPVVDGAGALVGVATRNDIDAAAGDGAKSARLRRARGPGGRLRGRAAARRDPSHGRDRPHAPAGRRSRRAPPKLVGLVTLKEALKARVRHLEEEGRRERVLPLSVMIPFARFRGRSTPAVADKPAPDREAV